MCWFYKIIFLADWVETQADTPEWTKSTIHPQKPHGLIPIIESYLGPPLSSEISTVKI